MLLPYLGEGRIARLYRFDEPWDGPNNRKLHSMTVGAYQCPGERTQTPGTNYLAVTGDATVFPGANSRKTADIKGGTTDTIMVVETASANIHWMDPRDASASSIAAKLPASKHGGGTHVLLADGSVRFIEDRISPAELKNLLTIDADAPPTDAQSQ